MKNENNNVTLKRRIDKLSKSLKNVDDALFTEKSIRDADYLRLEVDAQRLADYIGFMRKRANMLDDDLI